MRDLLFKRILPPRNEIIWNNQNIIIDGKAPFYKSWLGKKNILRVEDLLDNNGNLLPFNLLSENFHLQTPFSFYYGLIISCRLLIARLTIKRTPEHVAENDNNSTKISTKSNYSNMLKSLLTSNRREQNY